MAVRTVVKMGNKLLGMPSLPLNNFAQAIQSFSKLPDLLADMQDTMLSKGGVGIAAPQIGINERVIMFGFEKNPRYPQEPEIPFTILINPVIEILSLETNEGWEGCLSVPGLRGLVPRYTKIHYRGFDPQGNPISRSAEGFHARVVQHECDHLDGILYPQRIQNMRFFGFEEALEL